MATIADTIRAFRAFRAFLDIAALKAKHVGCVVLNGIGDLAVLAAMRALA